MQENNPKCTLEVCAVGQEPAVIYPGDFFLVHGENPFSRLIQFGQNLRFHGKDKHFTYWTHTGIFINGIGDIIEAEGIGVTQNNISYYKDMKYVVVHIEATEADREEMVTFAKACLGDGYGWLSILSIAL